jgi:glycosyltransferase involved in cell wall biosynthesis
MQKVNFWSSTEYSGFLAGLLRELEKKGFQARQRYQISEAAYRTAKSLPARLFLRFRQYVVYPLQLCLALILQRLKQAREKTDGSQQWSAADITVVTSNTFYAPLLATIFHSQVVHLVYDLFPEALIHSGKWREGSLKVRMVRWITRQTLRRSKINVFLGEQLKAYVIDTYGPLQNAVVIPVGADQTLFTREPQATHKVPTLLYCGNFGHMHDSGTLFSYWQQVLIDQQQEPDKHTDLTSHNMNSAADPKLEATLPQHVNWHFCCTGPKRSQLESAINKLPAAVRHHLTLESGLSKAAWVAAMESAEVALVTMTNGAETVVMPSKTYSAMMAGQAILAIAPERSDLVDLVKTADCGWWVEPDDVKGLSSIIGEIAQNSQDLLQKRLRAYHYAHRYLGQDALVSSWIDNFYNCG